MTSRTKWLIGGFIALVCVATVVAWSERVTLRRYVQEKSQAPLPTAVPYQVARENVGGALPVATPVVPTDIPTSPTVPSQDVARADVNFAVPFAPQAPFANWEQPYQDACEEATVIMVERYLRGASLSLAEMDAEILRLVDFQTTNYGFFKDSNIAETVRFTEAYYPHLRAEAHYDVTEADIRGALATGNAVVVLVNGQRLGNQFYTAPGPEKHTLVIKGVTGTNFITNDPGTRHGADFVYPISTVLGAMEDYDGGTPGTGKRGMILISERS